MQKSSDSLEDAESPQGATGGTDGLGVGHVTPQPLHDGNVRVLLHQPPAQIVCTTHSENHNQNSNNNLKKKRKQQ